MVIILGVPIFRIFTVLKSANATAQTCRELSHINYMYSSPMILENVHVCCDLSVESPWLLSGGSSNKDQGVRG